MILRLLSYNIRALRDDNEALFRVIRAADADVVCIQEAPRFLRWRSKVAGIARRSGLVVVTGGRPAGSNVIMSTLGVTVVATHDIGFTRDRGQYARGMAVAVLSKGPARFVLAGTHLDLVEAPRLRHIAELHATLDRLVPADLPRILAGDMNCRPGEPGWTALSSYGTDAWAEVGQGDGFTFRATGPFERIDGVFTSGAVRPVSATVLSSPDTALATDHCPLLVELEI
jgi:endonuclease/exonuclease/phosphatase family metal-dependent hydrolase